MRKECEARLRGVIRPGDRPVAVGTVDEFPQRTGDFGVQGRWRFLVVTKQRILLADWSRPDEPH